MSRSRREGALDVFRRPGGFNDNVMSLVYPNLSRLDQRRAAKAMGRHGAADRFAYLKMTELRKLVFTQKDYAKAFSLLIEYLNTARRKYSFPTDEAENSFFSYKQETKITVNRGIEMLEKALEGGLTNLPPRDILKNYVKLMLAMQNTGYNKTSEAEDIVTKIKFSRPEGDNEDVAIAEFSVPFRRRDTKSNLKTYTFSFAVLINNELGSEELMFSCAVFPKREQTYQRCAKFEYKEKLFDESKKKMSSAEKTQKQKHIANLIKLMCGMPTEDDQPTSTEFSFRETIFTKTFTSTTR